MREKDCVRTEHYLQVAQQPINQFMIFEHDLTQDAVPRALALYNLICRKDMSAGIDALNKYLTQISNPLRKIELQREFETEAKQLGLQ